VLSQIPGGAMADAVRWKRALVAIGIVMVAAAAAIFAFVPEFTMVFIAEILHGTTAGIITPAVGAISLGLVGQRGMSLRTGRNFRFAAAGSALTAAVLGVAGTYLDVNAIFIMVAAFAIPALIALACIKPDEINYARARNAGVGEQTAKLLLRLRELAKSRGLLLFMACVVLFQFADASMLPLVSEEIAREGGLSAAALSGLIIVPQVVVAALAPWVGYHSEAKGRRPLLLVGFALEPVRAVLLALTTNYGVLIVAQLLNGVTSAIITVLTVLVVSDLTAGTGRFNLARGAIGAAIGIAVSISTATTGFIVQHWGREAGFLAIAAVALGATMLLWVFQSETRPQRYQD
jgi:MFS family permease